MESSQQEDTRTLTPAELLSWAEDNTHIMRLRTFHDVLPGGYMAAMAPALVEWRSSNIEGDSPYIILRNLNYGGNPLEKTTTLHSARVPLDAVEYAELILVPPPSSAGGQLAPWMHVQLRFVFESGKEPELLNLAGSETGTDARIPDLVLSWESWRNPRRGFNVVTAMDEAAYGISQRAYAGAQRYLEDSLHGLEWFSYRLSLPGGRQGLTELLKVTLALGDGVARHTLAKLLQQSEADWLAHAPLADDTEQTMQQWQALQDRAHNSQAPEDPELKLEAEQSSYQTLVRSCATLSRYTVLLAANRLVLQGHTEGVVLDKLPPPALREPEEWMKDSSSTSLKGIFLSAPLALRYILKHPEILPVKIPEELAKAGIIACDGKKPRETVYSRKHQRPYGPDGINRI